MIRRCKRCNYKVKYMQKLSMTINGVYSSVKIYCCNKCNMLLEEKETMEYKE